MSEWQPIETAPRDRRILVIGEAGTMHVASWSQNPFTGHKSWLIVRTDDKGNCLVMQATHWQPLPEPPKEITSNANKLSILAPKSGSKEITSKPPNVQP